MNVSINLEAVVKPVGDQRYGLSLDTRTFALGKQRHNVIALNQLTGTYEEKSFWSCISAIRHFWSNPVLLHHLPSSLVAQRFRNERCPSQSSTVMAPLPNPTRFAAGKPSVAAVASDEEEDRQSFTGLANHWSQLKLLHGDGKTSPVRSYVISCRPVTT